jgi:hypothetical protein
MTATAYMTPAQWVYLSDANTLADLLSDSGTPVGLSTSPVAAQLLSQASGHLLAACLVSGIYSPEDLQKIASNDGDPSQSLMFEIIGQLATVSAIRRRPEKMSSENAKALREEAENYLDLLRNGKRLFAVPGNPGNIEAGQVEVDGPSLATMRQVNGITIRTRNYYPSVAQRLPRGRGGW